MIRIGAAPPPKILSSPFVRLRRREMLEFLRRPSTERRQRRPPVAEELFFKGELHDAVADRCRHKCVFCETDEIQPHVEHFRPVRVRDPFDRSDAAHDHYAWLAYEWDNLIYVCDYCQRARADRLPLTTERAPYMARLAEVRRVEKTILIDPYRETPERHFEFLFDGRCQPLTARANETMTLLELDSARLVHLRSESLAAMAVDVKHWADTGIASHLFDAFRPETPFLGARLNVLKRALHELPTVAPLLEKPLRTLPGRMVGYFAGRGVSPSDLVREFGNLRSEDESRTIERDRWPSRTPTQVAHAARRRQDRPSPRYIEQITLDNLKGVRHLNIKLGPAKRTRRSAPCLMLLGENATGKSTLLQCVALALLGSGQSRRLRLDFSEFLPDDALSLDGSGGSPSAFARVRFMYGDGEAAFAVDGGTATLFGDIAPSALVLGYGPRRFFDRNKSETSLHPFAAVRTLFDPLATLPYPGGWLNGLEDERFNAMARGLRPILALAETDQLVRDSGLVCVTVEDRAVPVEQFSDGYRSMFALAADIFRHLLDHFDDLESAHAIVLIDEIETHLHPRWKMQVMRAFRRALPNVQFIVTTHDPLCLRGMEDGEVFVFQRDERGEISVLDDLPSLKGMRAEQLLTSDYFGLSSTIDPETELDMARLAGAVADRPEDPEVDDMVARLTLGDSAAEQVIHEALRRFLDTREKASGPLRTDIRRSTVEQIYQALSQPLPLEQDDDSEPGTAPA